MAETVNEETGEITDDDAPITEEQVADAENEAQEDAPDDAAQAQAVASEKEMERSRKRIDRAVASMVKVLQEELADSQEFLQPCPRCAGDFPGLIWTPAAKGVLPETRAAVMISMGEDPDPTLNQDPSANRCDRCDGWGKVSTGSRVRNADKLVCEECDGRGWVGPRAARLATQSPSPHPVTFTDGDTNGHELPPMDPWGRVKGEPLYGVMPGFES